MWERSGWTRVVARYARLLVAAEVSMDPRLAAEVRQLEDRLGLSPMAMRRLMWRVDDRDELAERRAAPSGSDRSLRERVRVVDPDAVAGS